MRARAEVDELDLGHRGDHVHEDVLVFDVPVDDPAAVAGDHRLKDLTEKTPRHRLLQPTLLRDEVEEVLAARRPLQNQDVGVLALVKVEQADHAWDAGHLAQEADLQRDAVPIVLEDEGVQIVILKVGAFDIFATAGVHI